MTTASTFTIAYTSASDGSTSNGAKTLQVTYIDSDGMRQVATHTLSNTGSDVTAFSGLGINRCVVSSSGSTQKNGANITITETTGATIQAYIPAGDSISQQAIFFVDSNRRAVTKFLWINANKTSGGSSPKMTIYGYVFNRTIATRIEVFRMTIDTGVENTVSMHDPIGFPLSPTDVIYFEADTDTNSSLVNLRLSLHEYKRN